jgi:gas vesicle protein
MSNQGDYGRRDGSDVSTRLTYLLIGGGIGAILALLFAPKSGQELRGDIADVTRKGIDRTREAATQIGTRAEQYYEVGRDRAAELYSTATEKATELADAARDVARSKTGQVTAAIEAGKQAYVDEKRKTEASAMSGTGPNYKAEKQG